MTDIKNVFRALINTFIKAAREPSSREVSAAASMHLATQGIDMSTLRRD